MKKFNLKSMLCGFMAGIMVAAAVPVLAYNGSMYILATFKNIKIFVDGVELIPKDADGNAVEPLIYNGSTYLPIRAVCNATGKVIAYDETSNYIYMYSIEDSTDDSPVKKTGKLEPYKTINASISDVRMSGIDHLDALWFDASTESAYAYYNLNGLYTQVYGIYGFDQLAYEGNIAEINFYGDGVLLKTLNFTTDDLPKEFAVEIDDISELVIESVYNNKNITTLNNWTALADLSFR